MLVNNMKKIKSITKNKTTVSIIYTNNIYAMLYNDNVIVSSMEFNFINSLFDKWVSEL